MTVKQILNNATFKFQHHHMCTNVSRYYKTENITTLQFTDSFGSIIYNHVFIPYF